LKGEFKQYPPHLPWAVRSLLSVLLALLMSAIAWPLLAQTAVPVSMQPADVKTGDSHLADWLVRLHESARHRAYVGTFVVTASGAMASARIWHVCEGDQQIERIEALSGLARSIFRRNDQVMTFFPESRVVLVEKRESLGLFPNFLQSGNSAIAQFYRLKAAGSERVAGYATDHVQLLPQDSLRYGYSVWTEKKTGLVVKLQTLDAQGRVLEQSAFSELRLDVPVSMDKLSRMMAQTDGYQVEKPEMVKTTAAAQGWALGAGVPGFVSMNCFVRQLALAGAGSRPEATLQWIFSDGLASVSLFIEPYDPRRHVQVGHAVMGATSTLTQRKGDWWLTAVGEVPWQTLAVFAQGLERKK